nr:uncharacterized protein LOC118970478 [Manis javanica]
MQGGAGRAVQHGEDVVTLQRLTTRKDSDCNGRRERRREELLAELCPCCRPPAQSRRLWPVVPSAQRGRRSPDGGPSLCSFAPSFRRAGSGGTDLAPPASDRLLAPAGPPAPHSPLRGSPAAGGGRRSARTWSRRPGLTCARPAVPPSAWRRRTCGGASRAGPVSGVKATATALRAGRTQLTEDGNGTQYSIICLGPQMESFQGVRNWEEESKTLVVTMVPCPVLCRDAVFERYGVWRMVTILNSIFHHTHFIYHTFCGLISFNRAPFPWELLH